MIRFLSLFSGASEARIRAAMQQLVDEVGGGSAALALAISLDLLLAAWIILAAALGVTP